MWPRKRGVQTPILNRQMKSIMSFLFPIKIWIQILKWLALQRANSPPIYHTSTDTPVPTYIWQRLAKGMGRVIVVFNSRNLKIKASFKVRLLYFFKLKELNNLYPIFCIMVKVKKTCKLSKWNTLVAQGSITLKFSRQRKHASGITLHTWRGA